MKERVTCVAQQWRSIYTEAQKIINILWCSCMHEGVDVKTSAVSLHTCIITTQPRATPTSPQLEPSPPYCGFNVLLSSVRISRDRLSPEVSRGVWERKVAARGMW